MSKYTPELADAICEHIAQGKSLREIGAMDGMPDKATILRWCAKNETFRDQYARAKEDYAEFIAEEILEISDNAINDWMEANGDNDIGYKLNGEHVQRSRLRVDSRKWLAGKLKPKKYGDRMNYDVNGDVNHIVKIVNLAGKDEQ